VNNKALFSFFSGLGFLDLGFETTGYDVSFVNEIHTPFLDGYKFSRERFNVPDPEFGYSNEDINDLHDSKIVRQLQNQIRVKRTQGALVGFVGGPPCPDFSIGGKNKGRQGENGHLSLSYIELIAKLKPDFFLFENVKGLWRTKRHREFYEELKVILEAAGYALSDRITNAIEFGVPQDRDRIILLGIMKRKLKRNSVLREEFLWKPEVSFDLHKTLSLDWPTAEPFGEDGVRKQPSGIVPELTIQHWFDLNDVENHPNSSHHFVPRAGLKKFKILPEGDDSKKSFKRLHRWRYSPTAAYGNNEVHLHPFKARRISAAEALSIQSLPKTFELQSSMTLSNMFKGIGNGVPFLMAQGIANSFDTLLNENMS
jgi:DNA (cytosine-5)-methyltransferase 1